jgi:predicted DNA-binding protein with PD1-like motif
MWANKYKVKNVFVGRGDNDADLLEQINQFCIENDIKTGLVSAIGAIKNIRLGYYKQDVKKYTIQEDLSNKGPFEIVHCGGNVSLKDNKPFCHLHIVAADREGNCFGGHLMPGVKIFALEFVIQEFEGEELHRGIDEVTELPLWTK